MARVPRPWRRKDVGGAWYAQVNRRKVWLAPANATKAEAQKRLHELLAAKGKSGKGAGATLSTRDVLNLFAAKIEGEVARGETAADTLTRYRQFIGSAVPHLGAIPAERIRPADVQVWIDSEAGWGSTTRRHAVSLLKSAFRHARRFGHVAEDPLAEMPKPEGKRREAIMTAAQVELLLAAIPDQEFHDLVTALRRTGCRPSEVMSLTADRVDLAARTWRVILTGSYTWMISWSKCPGASSRGTHRGSSSGTPGDGPTPASRSPIASSVWPGNSASARSVPLTH
jgi:integrase